MGFIRILRNMAWNVSKVELAGIRRQKGRNRIFCDRFMLYIYSKLQSSINRTFKPLFFNLMLDGSPKNTFNNVSYELVPGV